MVFAIYEGNKKNDSNNTDSHIVIQYECDSMHVGKKGPLLACRIIQDTEPW